MSRDIQKVDGSHSPNLNRVALLALVYPLSLGADRYAVLEGLSNSVLFAIRAVVLVSWLAAGPAALRWGSRCGSVSSSQKSCGFPGTLRSSCSFYSAALIAFVAEAAQRFSVR